MIDDYSTIYIENLVKSVAREIKKVLLKPETFASDDSFGKKNRKMFENWGNYLGLITLAENKPILFDTLDIKALLHEAAHKGGDALYYIVIFTTHLMPHVNDSIVFKHPNAWTNGIIAVLEEINRSVDQMLINFAIEKLHNTLGIKTIDQEPNDEESPDRNYAPHNRPIETGFLQTERETPDQICEIKEEKSESNRNKRSAPGGRADPSTAKQRNKVKDDKSNLGQQNDIMKVIKLFCENLNNPKLKGQEMRKSLETTFSEHIQHEWKKSTKLDLDSREDFKRMHELLIMRYTRWIIDSIFNYEEQFNRYEKLTIQKKKYERELNQPNYNNQEIASITDSIKKYEKQMKAIEGSIAPLKKVVMEAANSACYITAKDFEEVILTLKNDNQNKLDAIRNYAYELMKNNLRGLCLITDSFDMNKYNNTLVKNCFQEFDEEWKSKFMDFQEINYRLQKLAKNNEMGNQLQDSIDALLKEKERAENEFRIWDETWLPILTGSQELLKLKYEEKVIDKRTFSKIMTIRGFVEDMLKHTSQFFATLYHQYLLFKIKLNVNNIPDNPNNENDTKIKINCELWPDLIDFNNNYFIPVITKRYNISKEKYREKSQLNVSNDHLKALKVVKSEDMLVAISHTNSLKEDLDGEIRSKFDSLLPKAHVSNGYGQHNLAGRPNVPHNIQNNYHTKGSSMSNNPYHSKDPRYSAYNMLQGGSSGDRSMSSSGQNVDPNVHINYTHEVVRSTQKLENEICPNLMKQLLIDWENHSLSYSRHSRSTLDENFTSHLGRLINKFVVSTRRVVGVIQKDIAKEMHKFAQQGAQAFSDALNKKITEFFVTALKHCTEQMRTFCYHFFILYSQVEKLPEGQSSSKIGMMKLQIITFMYKCCEVLLIIISILIHNIVK